MIVILKSLNLFQNITTVNANCSQTVANLQTVAQQLSNYQITSRILERSKTVAPKREIYVNTGCVCKLRNESPDSKLKLAVTQHVSLYR